MSETTSPAPERPKGLIEMPADIAAAVERRNAEQAAVDAARAAEMGARAATVAAGINNSRPEGMPPTLPTGETPVSTELTASTVRSGRGVSVIVPPRG